MPTLYHCQYFLALSLMKFWIIVDYFPSCKFLAYLLKDVMIHSHGNLYLLKILVCYIIYNFSINDRVIYKELQVAQLYFYAKCTFISNKKKM